MRNLILISISLFALTACRTPQTKQNTRAGQNTALKNEDPALQDGAIDAKGEVPLSIEGYASWYGKELQGRPTASGEMFDMQKMTGAHRDFPMGSMVLVKNIENGKKVVIKVNDRGPYVEGRIIDVSFSAARELGFAEKGVAKVSLELIQAGEDNFMAKADLKTSARKAAPEFDEDIIEPEKISDLNDDEFDDPKIKSVGSKKEKLVFLDGKKPKGYTVQVGAFKKKVNAERHRDEVLDAYPEKSFIATNGKWHFVCLGDFKSRKQAKDFLKKLHDDGMDVMYRGKV